MFNVSQMSIDIKIVSGTPPGVVASEAKKAQANWVILDKYGLSNLCHPFSP